MILHNCYIVNKNSKDCQAKKSQSMAGKSVALWRWFLQLFAGIAIDAGADAGCSLFPGWRITGFVTADYRGAVDIKIEAIAAQIHFIEALRRF